MNIVSYRRALKKLRYRCELLARQYLAHQKMEIPFLIIGEARTGTNLLASYLQSLENVSLAGEILSEKDYRGIRRSLVTRHAVLRHIERSLNGLSSPLAGAQVHIRHLDYHSLTLRDLRQMLPSLRFLIIYRKSIAEQYVSWLLARQSGHWVGSSSAARHTIRVTIDAKHFSTYICQMRKKYCSLLTSAELNQNSIVISYEELFQSPQSIFERKVFPLLRLPSSAVKTDLIKQSIKPLPESVANYEEIHEMIQNAVHDYNYDFREIHMTSITTDCSCQ